VANSIPTNAVSGVICLAADSRLLGVIGAITPKYPRLKSIKYLLNLSIHVKFTEFQSARLARDKILNNPESF
jgi:hypothetical protein